MPLLAELSHGTDPVTTEISQGVCVCVPLSLSLCVCVCVCVCLSLYMCVAPLLAFSGFA